MFNLEQSVEEWRKRMAAGIKTREVLDELESHLRDDIERQMRSGLNDEKSFAISVQHIGQIDALKAEFSKINPGKPMYSHNRIYSVTLAILTFYIGVSAIGLFNWQRMGLGDAGHLPAWALPWVTAFHVFYTFAMIVTLWSRRYGRDAGRRATLFLNIALLPAFPAGTVLAIYGLWKVDKEKKQFA